MELFKKKNNITAFNELAQLINERKNIEVQLLLQNIDSCELVDKYGTTLLHVASAAGNETMTSYLLDKKIINIDAQDQDGKTPIMLSLIDNKCEKVVDILLSFQPNIYIRDNFGKCALQMLFEIGLNRLEFLIRFMNILKIENQNDCEIIAWKLINMGCPLHYIVMLKNSDITRIALENGCPINSKDTETGMTPIHVCVELKDLENVKVLVEFGVDVNVVDSNNRIPFFYYSYDNSVEELEILKILVERTTSLTILDSDGDFAINLVAQLGNRETLMVLLNSNMDLNARDRRKNSPIHYFTYNNVLRGNPEIIESMQSKNFDVNATNVSGNSLVLSAASSGIYRLVHLLLNKGADANIANFRNYSPLYLASIHPYGKSYYKKCVELLLEHQADPQITTADGETIFDSMIEYKTYYALEAICSQLAIFENHGNQISNLIRDKINAHTLFKNKFESCKQQLEALKEVVIHKTMTLYKILNENQKTIALHAQNNDFYHGLTKFNNKYSSNSYYCLLLKSHLEKPIKYARMRREIIDILSKVMGLNYYSNHIVMDKIIEYVLDGIL